MIKRIMTALLVLYCGTAWGFGWSSFVGGGKRIDLTVSGWTAQGAWTADATYSANDVVTHSGSTWTAIQGSVNHEPVDGSLYWLKFIAKGDAATVSVGTVTSLDHSQSPTVSNIGTSGAAVFNFGIPAGAPGASGADGKTVLTTSGAPASGTGVNGDYAYDPATYTMYGPKAAGAWPAGTIIKGADGAGFTGGSDGTYGWLTDSNTSAYSECASGKYGLNFVGGVLYQCSNGTNSVFTSGDSLPSQTGNSGKYLTTNGTAASWGSIAAGNGIAISADIPTETGAANLNDTTHVLTVASTTGYTQFTGSFTAWDTTPDAFAFTDETDIAISTAKTSNAITVAGINSAAAISVTGDTGYGYSKNSAACTATSGTVVAGDTVAACVTSSGSNSTATTATVTIGGVSDVYSVTTAAGGAATYADDFDRADAIPISGDWTTAGGESDMRLVENSALSSSSRGAAYWSGEILSADQSSTITIGTAADVGILVRCATSGSVNMYYVAYLVVGTNARIFKATSGTQGSAWVQVGSTYNATTPEVGDVWKLAIIGNQLTLYQNGITRITASDSDITSGQPGIFSQGGRISSWAGAEE